jgi:hypothetical protein
MSELENHQKIILHLCAQEGSDSKPYRDAGYDVRIIGEEIGVENYNPPTNVYGIIANPPCTNFSIARTTAKTPRDLRDGMRLVKECLRIIWECSYRIKSEAQKVSPLKFWSLENPATGSLRWFLGRPAFEYPQNEYGGHLSKKTALWGNFNLPVRPILFNPLPGGCTLGKKNEGLLGTTSRSSQVRSHCPINFAMAFMEANP